MFRCLSGVMINEILSYRVLQLQKAIKIMELDFAIFEEKYSMTNKEFYNLFEDGKLSDENNDFYQWSGEYQRYKHYKEEISYLL